MVTDVLKAFSVVRGNRQRIVTIPSKRGAKIFQEGSRVKVINSKGYEVIKKVYLTSSDTQKVITIPKEDWEMFPLGEQVVLIPLNQPTKRENKQDDITQNFY